MSDQSIFFFAEDIDFSLPNEPEVIQWIQTTVQEHGFSVEALNFIFCSDEYLLDINREHLDHNYYTDIITFDLSDQEQLIEGDIFISIDRVTENAETNHCAMLQELHRVIIHGVLHLIGFNDKNEEQKKQMREKEDASLSLLKIH